MKQITKAQAARLLLQHSRKGEHLTTAQERSSLTRQWLATTYLLNGKPIVRIGRDTVASERKAYSLI